MLKIFAYSLPSLSFASLYFSIYVFLGEFYSNEFGISLSAIGLIFIVIRLFDAFSDPIMGYVSDNIPTRFGRRRPWVLLGGVIFIYSAGMLFIPSSGINIGIFYFALWLTLLTIGWTIAYSPYYALGAELSTDYNERSRITFFRELLALLGIVLASLLYSIGFDYVRCSFAVGIGSSEGLGQIYYFSTFFFLLSMIFFLLPRSFEKERFNKEKSKFGLNQILDFLKKQKLFYRLLISNFINGLANGFPPALFVFFVGYVLQKPTYTGPLLLLYFLGAILAVPFWFFLSSKYDKHRVWCVAMIFACIIFSAVLLVGAGDLVTFSIICFLSGLALSADLALPTSIQADVIDLELLRTRKRTAGQFFALWGLVSKSAIAISTGMAIILLDLWGFQSKSHNSEETLLFLSFLYAGVPIILKLISVFLMWNFELGRKKHKKIINLLQSKGLI